MSSDRARISYDVRRRYRGVVTQQGRVTLEADSNEDRTIAAELLRGETLDVVGPNGTPDDGFRVEPNTPPYDVQIGPGTLYVGGERVVLGETLAYGAQTEWLDHDGDPAWVDPGKPASDKESNELVYLYLEEHEVGAVEDSALFEVALGGPDSAQRIRLLQRIRRLAVDADTCAAAVRVAAATWAAYGLHRDPETQRLLSSATLEVSYADPGTSGDLCEPDAQGGYLGADNQLIRVQVSDPAQPKLVWGFDNASFLYRVQVGADLQTLTLGSVPVDDAHRPRAGQAVEVLRAAAQLETGTDATHELSPGDFVAAATGVVQTLTAGYDSDTRQLVLPSPLPAQYGDPGETPIVFLRVWEEETAFAPGTALELGTTGVSVTIDTAGGAPFHLGDYWQLGVRPRTPTAVYPERYLDQPQPPDGPRLWASPLAVVDWANEQLQVLEDCRNPFDNLVDLTKRRQSGCCNVRVGPADLTAGKTLQTIADSLAGTSATICLGSGEYVLDRPLRLGAKHSGLTIEACHGDAVLSASPDAVAEFVDGVVVLDRAAGVTLRGLRFELPRVPLKAAAGKLEGQALGLLAKQLTGQLGKLFLSIGVRPVQATMLTIEDCLFLFTTTAQQDVFAAGIFAGGECDGMTVRGCWFGSDAAYEASAKPRVRVQIGYLQAPSTTLTPAGGGALVPTTLQDATFRDNRFTGLTVAVYVYADCGLVALEHNVVRQTEVGFLVLALGSVAFATLEKTVIAEITAGLSTFAKAVFAALRAAVADPVVVITACMAQAYPWPEEAAPADAVTVSPAAATKAVAVESQPIWRMLERAETLFGGDAAATPPAASAIKRAETTFAISASQLAHFADAYLELAKIERAALLATAAAGTGVSLSLHAAGNEIDVRIDPALVSGPCLLVADTVNETDSSLTLTGNRMAAEQTPLGVALVLFVARCAITGNVIENANGKNPSLVVVPGATPENPGPDVVAVTGNVLYGQMVLPPRQYPPPFNDWTLFNALG
jgi:hypothetical protein